VQGVALALAAADLLRVVIHSETREDLDEEFRLALFRERKRERERERERERAGKTAK